MVGIVPIEKIWSYKYWISWKIMYITYLFIIFYFEFYQ
jgi:hypothetical protein